MKKYIILFFSIFIALSACSVCVYGATSDALNSLFNLQTDQAIMGKEFKAPYSAVQAGKEDINTMNGALNLSVTDISLPGINNFDLNLTRVYNNQDTE